MLLKNRSKEYNEIFPLMIEEFLDGKSLTSIANKYKVDRGTLSKNLKSLNFKIENKQNIAKMNENSFSKIDSEESAYWLGFIYADGCVMDDNRIELNLQKRDYEHLVKFCNFIGYPKENIKYREKTQSYRVSFRNKQIKENLISKGCVPRKSKVLTFPTENQLPKHLVKDFVRGYIDGDGYIGTKDLVKGKALRLSILGTEEFLEKLVEEMSFKKLSIRKQGNIYCVEWSAKYVQNYLHDLYFGSTIFLDRKYKILVPFFTEM